MPASFVMRSSSASIAEAMVPLVDHVFGQELVALLPRGIHLVDQPLASVEAPLELASWPRSVSRCRLRSSAEPPNTLKAITAAARFAARSTPITARIATRGSLMARPSTPACARLKLLGIVHAHAVPVEGSAWVGGWLLRSNTEPNSGDSPAP